MVGSRRFPDGLGSAMPNRHKVSEVGIRYAEAESHRRSNDVRTRMETGDADA